jgi:hypothetical protein
MKFPEIEIPLDFDDIEKIEGDRKWGVISKKGWVIKPKYVSQYDVQVFRINDSCFGITDDKMTGFVNGEGDILGEGFVYFFLYMFGKNYEHICVSKHKDRKTQFIINSKLEVLSETFDNMLCTNNFAHGSPVRVDYPIVIQNKKYGFINLEGKIIGKGVIYDCADHYENGYAPVCLNGVNGFIDLKGKFRKTRPREYYGQWYLRKDDSGKKEFFPVK